MFKITIHTRGSVKQKKAVDWALEVAKNAIDFYENVYFVDSIFIPTLLVTARWLIDKKV